jgi:hypothetical protein
MLSVMAETPSFPPGVKNLVERFARQRAKADRCLDELDETARSLARSLLEHGFTMREAAPLMSRADLPICHAQVKHARDGGRSRRPWAGRRRKALAK